jgi:anti-anti-sigma regulatory factor
MDMQSQRNTVCDTPNPGIRVTRFVRPDLRPQLSDQEAIDDCSLFRELDETALANLPAGETVLINFGLIDWFPTVFYRLLLRVREIIQARHARLMLCCFTPNVQEGFRLMGGSKVFEIKATEGEAIFEARKALGQSPEDSALR